MEIEKILNDIEQGKIVLPEFQREFVWNREHAKQLLISLIKGYPIGSMLFWQTDQPPVVKNLPVNRSNEIGENLILDGQQRLTTLYLFIKDEIPPFYSKSDIDYDPRSLYFNLESSFFEYYQSHKMDLNPLWQKVTDCFENKVDVNEIVSEQRNNNGIELDAVSLQNNLDKLRQIKHQIIPVQMAPNNATLDEAIEIFDRINSQGTPLTDADLVLAHIVGKWPEVRRVLHKKIEELSSQNFNFDYSFFARCIVIALVKTSLFRGMTNLHYAQISRSHYQEAWDRVSRSIDYLLPVLKKKAYLSSLSDLPNENVLIPIIGYLLRHGKFPDVRVRDGFLYWMFLASMWSRYAGPHEQRLERDVYTATHSKNPIESLINIVESSKGRTRLRSSDFEGHGSGHPLHRMLYIVTKWNNATDWVGRKEIREITDDYYSLHSQHIFPQDVLYEKKYRPQDHLDRRTVNEIANRAFLTRSGSYEFAHQLPSEYLAGFSKDELEAQMIPLDESLWEVDRYEDFLEERRRIISSTINEFLSGFGYHPHGKIEILDFNSLIKEGESNFVEFKAVLRSDQHPYQDKNIEFQVAKTISAFMNTGGGILLIGVNNDGTLLGLDRQYKTLGDRSNRDGFLLCLTQVINNYLGKDMNAFSLAHIEKIENKDICVIEINESTRPVYINKDGDMRFYIRAAASSEPLSPREAKNYIKSHW